YGASERSVAYTDDWFTHNMPEIHRVAKAQLKNVERWGSEYCELQNRPRRECGHCWQALLKEVE
ncbi:hypothetical protein LCGC14_2787840, partial [marine sediment metagenome]